MTPSPHATHPLSNANARRARELVRAFLSRPLDPKSWEDLLGAYPHLTEEFIRAKFGLTTFTPLSHKDLVRARPAYMVADLARLAVNPAHTPSPHVCRLAYNRRASAYNAARTRFPGVIPQIIRRTMGDRAVDVEFPDKIQVLPRLDRPAVSRPRVRRVMTVPQLARYLRCGESTIRGHIRAGRITAHKTGSRYRVRTEDLPSTLTPDRVVPRGERRTRKHGRVLCNLVRTRSPRVASPPVLRAAATTRASPVAPPAAARQVSIPTPQPTHLWCLKVAELLRHSLPRGVRQEVMSLLTDMLRVIRG